MRKRLRLSLRALYGLYFLASFSPVPAQNSQLVIPAGASLTVTANSLVLNNTDLHCDGTLDAANAGVWITGTNSNSFNGAGTPLIGTLTLNSGAADTLTLNNTLEIGSMVSFQQGLLDLHGQQLQLMGSAVLQGEGESSHIIGPTGGMATASATGVNNPIQLNIGMLGAALTSTANLGNTTISRSQQQATNPANSSLQGIQRTYLIQPQNNTALNATLRFYYLDAELSGEDASSLGLWKSSDGVSWQFIGADIRDATAKYVEKSGIADFSYWTLSDNANPLPLTLVTFKAVCEGGQALIQWQTGLESGLAYFEVEESPDGTTWTDLDRVTATDNPTGSSYSYIDRHPQSAGFYRLKIVNFSGAGSYSPVFRGGCSDIALPFIVYPNPAETQAVAQLSVRQAVAAVIRISDISGRQLYQAGWNLQPGINQYLLPVAGLAAGTYLVQLVLPNNIQQTQLIRK